MKKANFTALVAILIVVASAELSFADPGLIGDTVRVSRQIPSIGFTFGPFVYGVHAGPADTVALSTGTNLFLNVEETSLQFTFGPNRGSGGPYTPFQHFILFEDLSATAPTITGLTYQTDLPGFLANYLTFTAHSVTIAQGGLSWPGGQYLTINLQFIPEPSSVALIGIGVAVMIGLRRCRKLRVSS